MTTNKYWLFLEDIRKSGIINMYEAASYIEQVFGVSHKEAVEILADWMENYNKEDYV